MTTAVAKKNDETTREIVTWDDIQWDDDGSEAVRAVFPTVRLVQAVSTMEGSTKHIGDWHRSDTDAYIPSPMALGVLAMRRTRALWEKGNDTPLCRSDNGSVPAPRQPVWANDSIKFDGKSYDLNGEPRSCAECPFSQWGDDDKPPVCKASLVLMADLNVDGDKPELAQVRLSTTSIKPFEQFVARRVAPRGRKLCQFRFELGSEETVGGGNKYQRVTVYAEDLPKEKAIGYAGLLRDMRAAFEQEAARHDAPDTEAPRDEWGDGNTPLTQVED